MFCDVDSGDVRLRSTSPLLADPFCGQIGALGVGCGVTATVVKQFTADRVSEGVRVVWHLAEGATAAQVWMERSEAMDGGVWVRPQADRSIESGAVVELDRTAAPERPYWYRLVSLEGNETVVIGPPILVEARPRLEFRLAEVGPSPGDGPVRIAFTLQRAAAIEVGVFDVQGRSVASLTRGTWPAGTHELDWDGRTRGQPTPAGVYVVRYVYPGGQDKRVIVRIK
jgi:hypothetical protein